MLTKTYALSYGQQSQWHVHQIRGATGVYHDFAVFELTGALDLQAFCSAVELLAERHEALRTHFIQVDDEVRQVVEERWRGAVRVERAAAGADRAAALAAYIQQHAEHPFDITEGPLFRVGVLTMDDHSHIVAFVKHRMVADCWSLSLMLEEVSAYYAGFVAGQEVSRPAPAQTYDQFVQWQRSPQRSAEFDELLAYWTGHIGDAPRELRLRTAEVAVPDARRAEELEFRIPAPTADRLQDFTQSCGATMYMTLLAAFEVAVAFAARTRDLLIGMPVAGRTMIEFEESDGYFVNLLALRADLRNDPTITQLVRRVRETVLSGMAHQDLPFEVLLAELGVQPSQERHSLVQVTMQLIGEAEAADLRLPGLAATPVPVDEYQIAYAMTLNLYTGAEGLRGRLIYTAGEVDRDVAESVAGWFCRVVELMPSSPDSTVSGLEELGAQVTGAGRQM